MSEKPVTYQVNNVVFVHRSQPMMLDRDKAPYSIPKPFRQNQQAPSSPTTSSLDPGKSR